jgi:hypothetical protein
MIRSLHAYGKLAARALGAPAGSICLRGRAHGPHGQGGKILRGRGGGDRRGERDAKYRN